MRMRRFGCVNYSFLLGPFTTIGDVVPNAAIKQPCILQYHAE